MPDPADIATLDTNDDLGGDYDFSDLEAQDAAQDSDAGDGSETNQTQDAALDQEGGDEDAPTLEDQSADATLDDQADSDAAGASPAPAEIAQYQQQLAAQAEQIRQLQSAQAPAKAPAAAAPRDPRQAFLKAQETRLGRPLKEEELPGVNSAYDMIASGIEAMTGGRSLEQVLADSESTKEKLSGLDQERQEQEVRGQIQRDLQALQNHEIWGGEYFEENRPEFIDTISEWQKVGGTLDPSQPLNANPQLLYAAAIGRKVLAEREGKTQATAKAKQQKQQRARNASDATGRAAHGQLVVTPVDESLSSDEFLDELLSGGSD